MNKKNVILFLLFMFVYTMALIHILRPDLIFMTGKREKVWFCVEEKASDFVTENLKINTNRNTLINQSLDAAIGECDHYIHGYAMEIHKKQYSGVSNPDSTVDDIKSDIISDLKIYLKEMMNATFVQVDKFIEREK